MRGGRNHRRLKERKGKWTRQEIEEERQTTGSTLGPTRRAGPGNEGWQWP